MLKRDRLLSELLAVVGETLEEDSGNGHELIDGVRAWLRTVTGQEEGATFRPNDGVKLTPGERAQVALEIIKAEGRVTSGRLAKAAGVHPESARMTLAGMVQRGTLKAIGTKRRRYYRLNV
jgi:predicted HTH transcriptional regulator